MLNDLVRISTTPTENLRAVAEVLSHETGVLTRKRLDSLIRSVIEDRETAGAVGNAVYSVFPQQVEQVLTSLEGLRGILPSHAPQVTDDFVAAVRERLTALVGRYPAITLARKADRLERLTGSWCNSVDVLCDLRPVFDEERRRVEAMIPIQTLRIGYFDKEGNDAVAEIYLGSDWSDKLIKKLQVAKQKTDVLRQMCREGVSSGWYSDDTEESADKQP